MNHEELVFIRQLHEKAINKAYELGRWDHGDGKSRSACPSDFCGGLAAAWADGWNDEQAGKP